MTAPAPAEQPELLSIADLATAWDVHPDTIRNLIRRDELRAVRVARRVRIRRKDAEEYLNRT